jgi:mannose-6-phosphate isomerase-like protein (cupin superfamily)
MLVEQSVVCPVLIGRDAPLSAGFHALDRAHDAHGSTLLVSGEAGIGKSRFVRAVVERARALNFVPLQGACFEADRAHPYAPVLDLVRGLSATAGTRSGRRPATALPLIHRSRARPRQSKIAPHTHPTDEHVTVISGTFLVGMGKTFDTKGMMSLSAGVFVTAPAHAAHYALAQGETIVQVHAVGPFAMTYVNPADTPRAATSR